MSLTATLKKQDRKKKLAESQDKFFERVQVMKGDKGDQGDQGDQGPKGNVGPQGAQGIQGPEGKPGKNGVPGPAGKPGKDGRKGEDGVAINGKDGKPGKDGSPDTPQQVKTKLVQLPVQEAWFDARHIKNLPKASEKKRSIIKGGFSVSAYDLSSKLDGVTKSFTLPSNNGIALITGSAAPFIFRPTVDFTGANTTTLTFDAAIDAFTSLAAGQTLIVLLLA